MIISTKKGTPQVELDRIVDNFEKQGLSVTLIRGTDYNVFGLVGDTTKIAEKDVLANPWVENVTRVSAPYKRANRLFHPEDTVVDVNGIKIGMVCYTWAYSSDGTSFSLNGLTPIKDEGQMNYFLNSDPGKLYTAAEQILEQMKADGAEATMMFIHWGVEYNIKENSLQDTMAQKLCDLGFDVIVGGHPHVVQPVDLLTSTVDESHKTVVIYSLGNAVSNQRNGYIQAAPPYYTEDGILFTVTFEKYSDGAVYLQSVEALPTWVNMRTDGAKQYNILPLDEENVDQWAELFDLNDAMLSSAKKSMERTDSIVGAGMEKCRTYLEQQKADREAYYQDLASHPENYVPGTVPEETVVETTPETTAVTAPAA